MESVRRVLCTCRAGILDSEKVRLASATSSHPVQRPSMASFPSEFHGQCPSCRKQFATDSGVLRHMNHPRTSCISSFDFLESARHLNGQTSSTYQPNHNEPGRNDKTNHNTRASGDAGTRHYQELHPNVPLIFGSGPGFVDVFNKDQHAQKRRDNLYYPFSSKEEWGLASWLLCSGLSMRAIDDFLALPIVSLGTLFGTTYSDEKQDSPTFTLFYNCKNPTCPHGGSPQSPHMENANDFSGRLPDRKANSSVLP